MAKNKSDQSRTYEIIGELERRRMEALRLFRPLDYQERIFDTDCTELVVVGGNRSAKTLNCAIKFVSEALRIPVMNSEGKTFPLHCPNQPLLLWVIGKHENHIGTTIYDTLFKKGLFRVIRDEHTKDWRTYKPWDNEDVKRKEESHPAEPLIPERFIKATSWKSKASHVPEEVTLINGNVIRFYSSQAEAKQGDKLDYIWIDEDIEYPEHVAEWQARLSDKQGRLIWSAFPHSTNNALADMVDRAELQQHRESPDTVVIRLTFSDNPFIAAAEKRKRLEAWSDEDKRARDRGEFTFDSQLVFPSFSRFVHLSPPHSEESEWDEIDRILAGNKRPPDWTRYMSIDPGFNNCAIVFGAVPPPELASALVIEGELYLKRQNLDNIATAIKPWVDNFIYEEFIIDGRAARQTPLTGGPTYRQQYVEKFESFDIRCRVSGNDFVLGNDNIEARVALVRQALVVNATTGKPYLRMSRAKTQEGLQMEFLRYKYRKERGRVTDKIVSRYDHAMDALGYMVSRLPKYVQPHHNDKSAPASFKNYKKLRSMFKKESQDEGMWLGPPVS